MKRTLITLLFVFFGLLSSFADEKPELQFDQNGLFKIAQFTDIHYITENDVAQASVELIGEVIDAEKPQLVVFTGDIVVRGEILQGWDEILAPAIERKTPWAVVFGNHDDERGVSRQEIMDHLTKKPYCCAARGPENIQGVGNYVLEIRDANAKDVKYLLYCLDSNTYSKIPDIGKYGWFAFDQIGWYRQISADYKQKNDGKPIPALAFFHIPLNEYANLSNSENKIIGSKSENECHGAVNSGMFTAMLESGDTMGVFTGHDHVNDYIGVYDGIALAYGRFSGTKTTYTLSPHGSRIIELGNSGARAFKSWLRLSGGEVIQSVEYPQSFQKE